MLFPNWLLAIRARHNIRKSEGGKIDLPLKNIFDQIYKEKRWGSEFDFNSGSGSHNPVVIDGYVQVVKNFLQGFNQKPNVIDLGCGDFVVGSNIRPFCKEYIACDIVDDLIERNKQKYKNLNVEFRCLNMVDEALPDGDIVFLRQVLQHLNNEQIKKILPKLQKYKFLVLTEHLPKVKKFSPNVDIPAGPHIRLGANSGIVLTDPPFNLKFINSEEILRVDDGYNSGFIQTIVYKFF
jgi:SAM-dependent methyltransferase